MSELSYTSASPGSDHMQVGEVVIERIEGDPGHLAIANPTPSPQPITIPPPPIRQRPIMVDGRIDLIALSVTTRFTRTTLNHQRSKILAPMLHGRLLYPGATRLLAICAQMYVYCLI